jgi:GST-like protein
MATATSDGRATLYGCKRCGSAAVEMALAVAGLPYRHVTVWSQKKTKALEALHRVNPLGQVPTLVFPDGTVMSESAAILIELGLRHPQSGLLSSTPAERARQIRGLVYIAANCYAAIGVLDFPERWHPEPDTATKDAMRARGRQSLHGLWAVFADQFHDPARPWLSGERLGALDILAAVVSRWSGARAALAASRPAFAARLEAIDADPSVAEVAARHWGTDRA